jgi:hypothetical protein
MTRESARWCGDLSDNGRPKRKTIARPSFNFLAASLISGCVTRSWRAIGAMMRSLRHPKFHSFSKILSFSAIFAARAVYALKETVKNLGARRFIQ